MRLIINGKETMLDGSMSVIEYLASIGFDEQVSIAVAINGEIISKDQYVETQLQDGDSMEVVRAIGGG
ncbi:MAG: sulfur carrier protein ThiS [SAR202 cluster bacterium]|jgi:sulfur carrier protein|nr:sulfur carrier protein ThiS [SAR202 cluster bacterium]MEC7884148.1 sulfur carrier protein ThiS [Chloroflexota bacterium]MQG75650.1 sulfur carrier protein ThiS [SAR202 cluster bacterium]